MANPVRTKSAVMTFWLGDFCEKLKQDVGGSVYSEFK